MMGCRVRSLGWLLFVASTAAWADDPTLKSPTCVAFDDKSGVAYIADEHRILRSNDSPELATLIEDCRQAPVNIGNVSHLTFHNRDKLTIAGVNKTSERHKVRLATFRISSDDKPAFAEQWTLDFELSEADKITAITSTDFAIYLGVKRAGAGQLYRLGLTTSSLDEPKLLQSWPGGQVTGLGIDSQGHLLVAIHEPSESSLRYFEARHGRPLTKITTDVQQIGPLTYDEESRQLYTTATKNGRRGVYRLDVFFVGARQASRGVEISALDGLIQFEHRRPNSLALIVNDGVAQLLRISGP